MTRHPVPPAIALCFAAGTAEAHVSSGGIVDSYGGLLHPFTEPLHILTLLGLGFLLTQQGSKAPPLGWLTCISAALIGLAAGSFIIALSSGTGLMALCILLGGLVAWRPVISLAGALAISGMAGFLLGMDSVAVTPGLGSTLIWMLSVATGVAVALLIVMGWGDYFRKEWQQIGIRVIGSWIAASALLVLTLNLTV